MWVSTHLLSSLQLFNEVTEAELTLQNSGKVGFKYQVLSPSTAPADSPLPSVPLVLPSTVSAGVAPRPHVLLPGRGVIGEKKEKKKT